MPSRTRDITKKVLRALLAGALTFFLTYYLPYYLMPEVAGQASSMVIFFSGICIFFSMAGELTRGTIAYYLLDVVRGLTMIYFFARSAIAGVIIQVPMGGTVAYITIDMTIFFFAIVALSLFDIARSLMKAIFEYVRKKEEEEILRLYRALVGETTRPEQQ